MRGMGVKGWMGVKECDGMEIGSVGGLREIKS